MPDSDGLASLEAAAAAAPHLPIVVLTGLEYEALGVQAVRRGAQDYLVKGQATPRLLTRVIRHAIERNRLIEARSQFLANVSHELRTPMNAILGMIDVSLHNELNSTVRDCLNTARESADLLLGLLNNLLDSAKIQSGHLELETVPMSVCQVLDQAARILAVRAREKGLAFHWQTSEDMPDAVLGDKLRLREVLLNLGGNAIKFTERGEVAVSVRVLREGGNTEELPNGTEGQKGRIGEREDAAFPALVPLSPSPLPPLSPSSVVLEFSVRDTGVGIPRGDLDRVFKPFAQADSSNVRRSELAGPGACDFGRFGCHDGRPPVGRKRAGTRQHVPFHGLSTVGGARSKEWERGETQAPGSMLPGGAPASGSAPARRVPVGRR